MHRRALLLLNCLLYSLATTLVWLPALHADEDGYEFDHEESYLEVLVSAANNGAELAPGETTTVETLVNRLAWEVWI
ncbi:MAG: hypothetical protein ABL994_24535, partial [Verrucomicrobiales bacterium]